MQITNSVNFNNFKRFFAFGCSFTNYKWPMWPDIIANYIPESYNLGVAGSDNRLIFLRLMEADAFYNFNENDLIMVMFTNHWRDTDFDLEKNFILTRKSNDQLRYKQLNFIFRDFCFFKAAYHFLEQKNVHYDILSMSGYSMDLYENYHLFEKRAAEFQTLEELISKFSVPLNFFKPSIFELCYQKSWGPKDTRFSLMYSEEGKLTQDNHPTPFMSLRYLKSLYNCDFEKCEDYVLDYENKVVDKVIKERLHPQYNYQSFLGNSPLISL